MIQTLNVLKKTIDGRLIIIASRNIRISDRQFPAVMTAQPFQVAEYQGIVHARKLLMLLRIDLFEVIIYIVNTPVYVFQCLLGDMPACFNQVL